MFGYLGHMKKVYFISGLGADERAFQFLDLCFCQPQHINWKPVEGNPTLQEYATNLSAGIVEDNPTIVGLSLGGMLATEIAKQKPGATVILLSSAKTRFEVPWYYRMWRRAPVYRFQISRTKVALSGFITFINGPKGKLQQEVFKAMLKQQDPYFTRWAIDAILGWNNTTIPPNVTHIHGTADKVLPYRFVKADYTIAGGEHVMLMNQGEAVSTLLQRLVLEQ